MTVRLTENQLREAIRETIRNEIIKESVDPSDTERAIAHIDTAAEILRSLIVKHKGNRHAQFFYQAYLQPL